MSETPPDSTPPPGGQWRRAILSLGALAPPPNPNAKNFTRGDPYDFGQNLAILGPGPSKMLRFWGRAPPKLRGFAATAGGVGSEKWDMSVYFARLGTSHFQSRSSGPILRFHFFLI